MTSYRFCSRQQENPELTESQVFMYFSRLGLEEEEEVLEVPNTTFCVEHRIPFGPLSNDLEYPVFHWVKGDGLFKPLVPKQL